MRIWKHRKKLGYVRKWLLLTLRVAVLRINLTDPILLITIKKASIKLSFVNIKIEQVWNWFIISHILLIIMDYHHTSLLYRILVVTCRVHRVWIYGFSQDKNVYSLWFYHSE